VNGLNIMTFKNFLVLDTFLIKISENTKLGKIATCNTSFPERRKCTKFADEVKYRRIFSRGVTRGFVQKFFRGGLEVVKFVFSHSKLRKQFFLLKFSKSRGNGSPAPPFRRPYLGVFLDASLKYDEQNRLNNIIKQ